MISLASIEGKAIFIAFVAIVGVINWIVEQTKKKGSTPGTPATPATGQQDTAARGSSDEQERLRRFLESLGVPQPPKAQQPSAPPATRPQPQPQQQRPRPVDPRMQVQQPQPKPRKKAAAKSAPVNEPRTTSRPGRIEEAASSIERISGEFSTMNVHVAMEPVRPLESAAHLASGEAGTTAVTERDINPLANSVRKLLMKPSDLRSAYVAMEILGPPRGLQS